MSEPQHPRRRDTDRRERWGDDRIDDLAGSVRMLASMATQVAQHQAHIDELRTDIADFKVWLSDVEGRLTKRIDSEAEAWAAFRTEYREDRKADRKGRGVIIAAAITAAGTTLVGLVSAAVLLATGGG